LISDQSIYKWKIYIKMYDYSCIYKNSGLKQQGTVLYTIGNDFSIYRQSHMSCLFKIVADLYILSDG